MNKNLFYFGDLLTFPGGILLGMIEGISIMMNRMAGEEAYRGTGPVVMVTF